MTQQNLDSRGPDEPLGFTVEGILNMAGGSAAVARHLGRPIQTIRSWTKRIPHQHARAVAILAGLPLEVVRPDMVASGHAEALEYIKRKSGGGHA